MSTKPLSGKSLLKRTLPIIITLVVIIATALTFSLIPNEKPVPQISNPNGAFVTIGEHTVTNKQIYNDLRGSIAVQEIVDHMDRILLASYLPQVTEQMITDAINKAIFNTTDISGQTSADITEKTQAWMDSQYLAGLRTEEAVRDYYRLQEAKRIFAREKFVQFIADTEASTSNPYYTATKFSDYYNANYKPNVQAIVLKFATNNEAKKTMEEFGIMTSKDGLSLVQFNADLEADEVALSPKEISLAFIAMYNQQNAYKVADGVPLKENVHYTVNENTVTFTTLPTEKFISLNHEYVKVNTAVSALANHLFNTLQVDSNNFSKSYSTSPRNYTGSFYLALKFGVDEIISIEEAEAEIKEIFIDQDLTQTRIDTEMKKLRIAANLKFYDEVMEQSYVSYDSNFKKTKDKSTTLVASFMNGSTKVEISADMLFEKIANRSGISTAVQHLNHELLVNNLELNTIYNFSTGKVLNKTKYDELKDQIQQYKTAFASNNFSAYGYPASMGWKAFIQGFFGVDTETDVLHRIMIYGEVYREFVKTTYDEAFIRELMETAVDDFFSASVLNFVITVDFDGNLQPDPNKIGEVHPEYNWTQAQKDLVPGLVTLVQSELDRLVSGTITYKLAFDQIVVDYNNATRTDAKWGVYKSAGLNIKIEDLGALSNTSSYVQEFLDGVKVLWDRAKLDNNLGTNEFYWSNGAFETSFGFHYIGIYSSSDYTYANKAGGRILPTDEEIAKWVANANDPDLTTVIKTAISTWYSPAKTKAEASDRVNIELAKYRDEIGVNFTTAAFNTYYARMVEISAEQYKG